MLISVDIGDLSQSVRAIEKLLNLNAKNLIDEKILEVLLEKILLGANGKNQEEVSMEKLGKKMMEVMARISARQSLNSKVFF